MNFAAARTGTSIDQVREAFAKVLALVGKFMTGDKNAAGIMGQLWLTREDLAGLNAEQTFDKVNRALHGIGDEQTRNAVAAKLYGETFQKLNNFLRDYVELGEEAQSRGLIVSDETIKAAEDLKDAMTNAGTAFMAAMANSGAVELIDWLANKLLEKSDVMAAISQGNELLEKNGVTQNDNRPWWRKLLFTGFDGNPSLLDNLFHDGDINKDLTYSASSDANAAASRAPATANRAPALENQILESAFLAARMNLGSLGESEQKLLDQAKTAEEVYDAEDKIRIAALEQELKYQQMIMQGKAREVEIEKQLRSEAKARGIDVSQLDAATVERIRNAAGARYALQHPEQAAASGAAALSSRIAEYPTDALRRIGGYSGAFNSSNPSLNYQRKSTDFLDKINQRVSSIEQNLQTSGTSGATFP